MSVAVIVPWRGGCRHRERAWGWIRDKYRAQHPDWKIVRVLGPDPWVKAEPVNAAAEMIGSEIVVVADADVWCEELSLAVEAVKDGAPWATPHRPVRRLTEESTLKYMAGTPWQRLPLARRPYAGVPGGGLVVTTRDALQNVPMDPRYVGWGQEDQSWGLALHCLLGPRWMGKGTLIHLWHPPLPRMDHRYGNPAGKALYDRYLAARRDPDQMALLLEEVYVYRSTHKPILRAA